MLGEMLGTFVKGGWSERFSLGDGLFLLRYPGGEFHLEHTCDRGERGIVICAPEISTDPGWHTICAADPLTISPSIACGDCALHGWIRDGQWTTA